MRPARPHANVVEDTNYICSFFFTYYWRVYVWKSCALVLEGIARNANESKWIRTYRHIFQLGCISSSCHSLSNRVSSL